MRIPLGVVLVVALSACGEADDSSAPDLSVVDDEQPGANWPLASDEADGGQTEVEDLAIVDLAGADLAGGPADMTAPEDLAPPGDAGVSLSRLVAHQKGSDTSPSGYYSYVPPTYLSKGHDIDTWLLSKTHP